MTLLRGLILRGGEGGGDWYSLKKPGVALPLGTTVKSHLSMLDHKVRFFLRTDARIFLELTLCSFNGARYNRCQTAFPMKDWRSISPTSNLSSRSSVNVDRKLFFRRGSLRGGGKWTGNPLPSLRTASLHGQGSTKEASAEETRQEMRHARHLFMICYLLIKWRQSLTQLVRSHQYICVMRTAAPPRRMYEIISFRPHITTINEIQSAQQNRNELDYPSCCFCIERYDNDVCCR